MKTRNHCCLGSSPGKSHTIRLYNQEISVNLSYSSPEKSIKSKTLPFQVIQTQPSQQHPQNQFEHTHSRRQLTKRKKKKYILENKSKEKEFYRERIDECYNVANAYEEYQELIKQNKVKKRLKVYSTSRRGNHAESTSKDRTAPLKIINLKFHKPAVSKKQPQERAVHTTREVNTRKVVLTQTNKRVGTICLYQKSKVQRQKQLTTPTKPRSRKIEITSSSRRKNDSMLSKRQGQSVQLPKNYHNTSGAPNASVFLNSLNYSELH